jgi:hypothetical protein
MENESSELINSGVNEEKVPEDLEGEEGGSLVSSLNEDDEDFESIIGDNEIKDESPKKRIKKSTLKYYIDLGLIITFSSTFITGVIKFSPLTNLLGINPRTLPMGEISFIHDWGAMAMGFLILGHLLLNWSWISNMTKKRVKNVNVKGAVTKTAVIIVVILMLALVFQNPTFQRILFGGDNYIAIDGVGDFQYFPSKIETVRSDIFQEGHFSVFDILVYLNNTGKINMEYHFDSLKNTYLIDNINGMKNWWYQAYYDGGWPENNAFRMDHYPFKEKMIIRIMRENEGKINRIYDVFEAEGQRESQNGGGLVVPTVIIRGTRQELRFQNVQVTPHNLRNDMLQNGTIVAIDVIMSLGDAGLIDYELQWYSNIGSAEVKNYFVEKINSDKSHDRCGFVYEAGSYNFRGFSGNHIHIPSDIRVINHPDYVEFFWICI